MSSYKESVIKKIKKVSKQTRKAIDAFFNASLPIEARLKAFKICGTFLEEPDVKQALAIIKDKQHNEDSIRAAAIMGLVNYASKNSELQDTLLEYLNSPEESEAIKLATLSVLQSNTFSSPSFNAKRPEYASALRNLIKNNNATSVKERSAEYLALEKDEYIQRVLIEGLENPEKKIVEPEVAIQLLSYDLHSDLYPMLRNIVENPPNQRSKKEALRYLCSDPDSADLLLKTLNDKEEDKETRHVCAVGLQALQPELLQASLKTLLTDKEEDNDLKVALLNTLNYAPDTSLTDGDSAFQSQLKQIQKKSKSKKMTETYQKYQKNKLQ